MPVVVTCPSCGRKFRVGDEFAGQPVACPGCSRQTTATGPTVPPYDAFVSYSSNDKATADAAVATLEADGIRCWVAPRDIVPGKPWGEAIIDGINNSRMMVLVFSAHSDASQQVLREVERAVHRKMPIVPFRIENLLPSRGMEYFISASHWLDAYHPPLDDHLRRLSATARALLEGMDAPPEEGPADLRGRLRAAVRALTARDNRVRVLAGLVGLVFLIGVLTFAAVYALRPKPTPSAPAELVQAKADAEVLAKKVGDLDRGQGVGAKADEVENHLKAAQTLFTERKFAEAGEHFQAVATLAPQVIEAARQRDELRTLRAEVEREFAAVGKSGAVRKAAGWAEVERQKQAAELAFAGGDFAAARAAWAEARTQLADYQINADVIAEKKALAFWLGFAGRSLWASRRLDDLLKAEPGFKPLDVSQWKAVLRGPCKDRLGLKPDSIDTILNEQDNNALSQYLLNTLPDEIRATPGLGLEVQRAFLFGNDLAALTWAFDTEAVAGGPFRGPNPAEMLRSWYPAVIRLAGMAGASQEMVTDLEAARTQFDKDSAAAIGDLNRMMALWAPAAKRLFGIVERHAGSVDVAAKGFARTLTCPGVPGQEALLAELRRVRAAVYFDDHNAPKAVTGVYLFGPVPDPGRALDAVSKLTSLHQLHMGFHPVTDADVAKLRPLSELRSLFLNRTRITDGALEHLRGMTKLEVLYLNNTGVTDKGLAQLHGLKALREVDVEETQVTLAGAKALADALPKVEVVPFKEEIFAARKKEFLEKSGIGPDGELVKKDDDQVPPKKKADLSPTMRPPREIAMFRTEFQETDRNPVYLALTAGGKAVAASGQQGLRQVRAWDPATRKELSTWEMQTGAEFRFSADGNLLVDDALGVFNVRTGKPTEPPEAFAEYSIQSHAVAPDGKTAAVGLFAGADTEAKVLRLVKLPELTETAAALETFEGWLLAVAYSPDGTQLAALLRDRKAYKLLRLDPKTGAVKGTVGEFEHGQPRDGTGVLGRHRLVFSPDGKTLATQLHDTNRDEYRIVWGDVATGKTGKTLTARGFGGMEFIAGGSRLAVVHQDPAGDGSLEAFVYETASGKLVSQTKLSLGEQVDVLSGPRGLLISGRESGEVVIWNLVSDRMGVKFQAHAGPVRAIAVSPEGKHLATFGAENKVKVWALE